MNRKTLKFKNLLNLMSQLKSETQSQAKARHVFAAGVYDEQTFWFREHHNHGATVEMTARRVYFEVFRFSESDDSVFECQFAVRYVLDSSGNADRIARYIDVALTWMNESEHWG